AQDPKPFGGEEVVWENGTAIWIMHYYGFLLAEEVKSEDVYAFLRKAMDLVDEEKPFRGPTYFKEGDFEYKDQSEGDVTRFKGTERIFFRGREVYRLYYHGGAV
ncbi:MAG: DUF5680 domain-containing protein, partial [Nanoarchaeota archaeon]